MLKMVYGPLSRIRSVAIIAILAFIIGLCLVQIVLRYLTSTVLAPFAWGDEIIRLSSIWVVFLAASLGVRESSHLRVDFFVNRLLSGRRTALLKKAAILAVMAALGALVWFGVEQTRMNVPSLLENLPLSRAWFYAAVPVGCAYLLLDYALILVYGRHPFASGGGEPGGGE
ncbi:MAG: TRAP transporter small permease subunit [Planctomycetota bacterium]|jgi:TRAP-type C4-dicarboxylate transport system permease small subunit|nr:TRAP transporter small permease subunit [Planctomycetota bacterium]